MLENIREMADFPAAPRMKQSPVAEFYRNLESTCGDRLPTWNGELYLELHRGTYTTQSRNKWANRKSEFLLHDAEFVATLAQLLAAEYEYPRQELNKAWELVCLNQFHDIIPGSSIAPVYVESQAQYATVREMTEGVRERALEVISKQMGGDLLLLNPIGFERRDLVFWPGKLAPGQLLRRADGAPVSLQETETGTWIDAGPLPALSVTELIQFEGEETPQTSDLTITTALLENQYLRIELNERGELTRLYDKAEEREVLPIGSVANQFQAFEDRPLNWDAWDVDIFYDDKMYTSDSAATVTVVEAGPLRATLEVRHQILNSDYVQRISLEHDSRRVDFDTTIEWRERHILLKVAFPVEILSPTATYEIQWGNVERPTHRNTSWDWARFETCAQKWVDLSEGDYGVSLLNDCKYGHDIHENVMRISLLRGPTLPDPDADLGEHHFAYSLLPHKTDWQEETVTAAYAINDRVLTVSGSGNKSNTPPPLISVVEDNVAIETIKQAEDGNGIIVRLYEYRRRRGPVTLTCGIPIAEASRVNLLEEPKNQLEHTSHSVTLNLHPFEIATVRLLPA
jgi:alpha-mannosidase